MNPNIDTVLAAIRAKCLDCSGHQRKLVDACYIHDCPLYPYRNAQALPKRGVIHTTNQISFEMLKAEHGG